MPKRRLYSEALYKKAVSATEQLVEGRVVEPGWILYVTSGSLEDETTAPTTVSFGKKVGERFEGMEELETPSSGIRYHLDKTHHFIAGERPVWRVEGATVNDILRGYLEGYYEEAG